MRYNSELMMKKENSYGIVPLRFQQNEWEILLIQHQGGHWAFPKGHLESGESPLQAAERELQEETALSIAKFLSQDPLTETYFFTFRGERIFKTVHYFLALVTGEVVIQEEEIKGFQWVLLKEAEKYITFKEGKRVCQQTIDYLHKKQNLN